MAVYVDKSRFPYGRMIMCHMVADSDEELHAMADSIGLNRKWHQYPGTYRSHYDISLSFRKKAIAFGAVEISRRELGVFLKRKKSAALDRI